MARNTADLILVLDAGEVSGALRVDSTNHTCVSEAVTRCYSPRPSIESLDMQSGLLAALGAFFIWGLLPIYWKTLDHVPALQITAHRLAWCCLWVVAVLMLTRGTRWWRALIARPRVMRNLTVSAGFIGINWFVYIWAVNSGHIVETSLGYFINPLVNVLFGVLLFAERLNPRQWSAVTIAAVGVAYMTIDHGRLPWIALTLAGSFGLYSVIRKVTDVDSVTGLAWESMVYLPFVSVWLFWLASRGEGSFGQAGLMTDGLLMLAGALTAVPLILFSFAARRVPLSTIGVLQYLAPTLQLGCGTLIYGEPFTRTEAIGFGCIWTALAIYTVDGLRTRYRTRAEAAFARRVAAPTPDERD